MKKTLAIILALVMLFALCACERDLNSHYRHLRLYLQLCCLPPSKACVLKKVHTKKEPALKR